MRKASRLAHDLAAALDDLIATSEESEYGVLNDARPVFDDRELKTEYQNLRSTIETGASIESEVADLVENSSKERLKALIRANGLPMDSNLSKSAIKTQLAQLLRQSKAIGAPVKTLASGY